VFVIRSGEGSIKRAPGLLVWVMTAVDKTETLATAASEGHIVPAPDESAERWWDDEN